MCVLLHVRKSTRCYTTKLVESPIILGVAKLCRSLGSDLQLIYTQWPKGIKSNYAESSAEAATVDAVLRYSSFASFGILR